jgi:hypothetical protein
MSGILDKVPHKILSQCFSDMEGCGVGISIGRNMVGLEGWFKKES